MLGGLGVRLFRGFEHVPQVDEYCLTCVIFIYSKCLRLQAARQQIATSGVRSERAGRWRRLRQRRDECARPLGLSMVWSDAGGECCVDEEGRSQW